MKFERGARVRGTLTGWAGTVKDDEHMWSGAHVLWDESGLISHSTKKFLEEISKGEEKHLRNELGSAEERGSANG